MFKYLNKIKQFIGCIRMRLALKFLTGKDTRTEEVRTYKLWRQNLRPEEDTRELN